MTQFNILFGTESGNAEMAAEDLGERLNQLGHNANVISMENATVDDCKSCDHLIILTSTYGEGDLPETAAPFFDLISQTDIDLSDICFSAFGLGDSSYENYNNAIDKFVQQFRELNAELCGTVGKYDASSNGDVSESAIEWAEELFQ
jgi:MioC protein